jgi:hypothetical protein
VVVVLDLALKDPRDRVRYTELGADGDRMVAEVKIVVAQIPGIDPGELYAVRA